MAELHGDISGLSPRARTILERLYRRRVPPDRVATPELLRGLADASRATERQVGVLVHRGGEIESVIVGSPTGLFLPDVGRLRAAAGRFRALRLVHTHLFQEPLTRDDLTDLTRLRLDLVAALLVDRTFEPRSFTWAVNVPAEEGATPYSITGPAPWGEPQPHFAELIASLEQEFARRSRTREVSKDGRAILIHVGLRGEAGAAAKARTRLDELDALARTAGVLVVDRVSQLRDRLDPRFLLGRGKLEDVIVRAIDLDADVLVFDHELSPSQATGIESHTDLRVIDRTQLILDIFAQRAESADGKLQVELAQLRYALPRLATRDDALSRLTGGIGGRGPGETKLEIGRRRARERVTRLERRLAEVGRHRSEQRRLRRSSSIPVVALVGYTNAGKSTLMNALTSADVLAADVLFATLDPRARRLPLPDGRVALLTDTVGLIRDMPRDLFAAFRATFEEIADADLLLEVVDASSPEREDHERTTLALLVELGLERIPRLRVYNKADRLGPEELHALEGEPRSLTLSATSPGGPRALAERIAAVLPGPSPTG
ncbi:MAG: GTPase HflX [Deltaproteobacteria bacterium]|nr:GTPase HflX [Deltaproteobacteria bacterium]